MNSRRLIALLCLVVVLIAALNRGAVHSSFALLTPLWLFFGLAASLTIISDDAAANLPLAPFHSIAGSRAPPSL